MTLLYVRALAPYEAGANATDVVINKVHFNRTALDFYNYKLFSNGTLSNGSECYLAFNQFQPFMFSENGTFVNGTSCYAPIVPIGSHASLGLAFTVLFTITIFLSLLNLRKHGRRYLPADRNWLLMGRRWKWYWLVFVGVCGLVSCIMSIDVDRGYLPSSPLIIQSIFYTLMTPGIMAAVWEAVRHWASWEERLIKDRDPYAFTKRSTRKPQERLLPILFYATALANLLLTVPRSWSPIEHQRSPSQAASIARPAATDARWRAAAFVALAGVLVTCYSLEHSIYRYRPRPTSTRGQLLFYLQAAPSQFLVAIAILGVKVGYAIASAFDWSCSPYRFDGPSGWIYGLGYTPVLMIVLVLNVCGFCELNEDKALLAQRDEIETALASEAGIGVAKPHPHWWRKSTSRRKASVSPRTVDPGDLSGVEMGVVRPRDRTTQTEDGILGPQGQGQPEKEDAKVTTRTASQGSSISTMTGSGSSSPRADGGGGGGGPGLARHQMEYVVQPGNGTEPRGQTLG